MTSVACCRTDWGMVSPSAWAVFRLMMKSNSGRLLHRQVSRFGPLQDLTDERRGTPIACGERGSVGHQAALLRPLPLPVHRRQAVLGRELDDPGSIGLEKRAAQHEQRLGVLSDGGVEGRIEVVRAPHRQDLKLDAQGPRGSLRLCDIPGIPRTRHILKHREPGERREHLFEQIHPLPAEQHTQVGCARHVARPAAPGFPPARMPPGRCRYWS